METELHLYEKVVQDIQERVKKGELSPGSRLPPIRDLSVHYDCNYHTIRRAMKSLSEEGLIESKKGSGTYIRKPHTPGVPVSDDQTLTVVMIAEETPYSNRLCAYLQTLALKNGISIDWGFVSSLQSLILNREQIAAYRGSAILIPWFRENDRELQALRSLKQISKKPVISSVNQDGSEDENCFKCSNTVGLDSRRASQMAAQYFLELGCEALVLVGNANEAYDSLEFQHRLNGFQQYCMDKDITNLICLYDPDRPELSTCKKFIEKHKGEVGLICFHDDLAMRIMRHLNEDGIDVPNDCGIIGFNNQNFCEALTPPLTSMSLPFENLAEGMLKHAIARMQGQSDQINGPLPIHFHLRESCAGRQKLDDKSLELLIQAIAEI